MKDKEREQGKELIQKNEQKLKKANSQMWDNLHRNKKNMRNIDSKTLTEKVNKMNVSESEKEAALKLAKLLDNNLASNNNNNI